MKFKCLVCGQVFEVKDGEEIICPVCKATGDKVIPYEESSEMVWADEHVIGVAKNASQEIIDGLKANFNGECSEVGMYLAMSRQAYREGYPEIGLLLEKIAHEEAEHAARFCEMIGDLVTNSTKSNIEKMLMGENGACKGKKDIATMAKKEGLDAIHDSVHEMAKDEARHGMALEAMLKRYFK